MVNVKRYMLKRKMGKAEVKVESSLLLGFKTFRLVPNNVLVAG